jgi:hypothetical protein
MTQSFAFNPHASQEANQNFVRFLHQQNEQNAPPEEEKEAESKPVINLKPKRQRARSDEGKFAADNPETPQDEAWQE